MPTTESPPCGAEQRAKPGRLRRWLDALLLVATGLLFLASFLVWLSAPTAALWIVAIILSEWGHFAAVGLLIGAALAWRLGNRLTALVALLAAFNLLSPVVRAVAIGRTLPEKCTAAFGNAAGAA